MAELDRSQRRGIEYTEYFPETPQQVYIHKNMLLRINPNRKGGETDAESDPSTSHG